MTRRLYRAMVFAQRTTAKEPLFKSREAGDIRAVEGQEAAQVGSAAALHPDDWMVATYRDAAAMWMQDIRSSFIRRANRGRTRRISPAMSRFCRRRSRSGGHMVHAVGLAWAAKNFKDGRVALTYFGDGATVRRNFHEAMNFAAVFEAPCSFLPNKGGPFRCQGNCRPARRPSPRRRSLRHARISG